MKQIFWVGVTVAAFSLVTADLRAAQITVTGTGDTVAVDGLVTLREAVTSANNNADVNADVTTKRVGVYGTETIFFSIPGAGLHTINVTAPLPTITGPISIDGYSQPSSSLNTLANGDNAIILIELNGANAGAGTAKVGVAGLTLGTGSGGSTIQGLVINRFSGDGILIKSPGNLIIGNFIGTNAPGTLGGSGLGNANTSFDLVTPFRAGVFIDNVINNQIGNSSPGTRNVISGNILDNVHIVGTAASATGNKVQGNFIGLGVNGTSIVFASGFFGIELSGVNASANTIGGTASGNRNVIGGNGDGIDVDDGAHHNFIQGNFSGVGADGVTAAANRLHGIVLRDLGGQTGVSGNQIGGTVAGAGNLIGNNGSAGVAIFGDPSFNPQNVDNAILGNSIFMNGRSKPAVFAGIDLVSGTNFPTDDGVTPDDFGDGDEGPNHLQNFPALTSVSVAGGTTTINGSLNSRNNNGGGRTYRIEFFSSLSASGTGFGEGQTFLGFVELTLGANPGPFVDQGQATGNFTANISFTPAAGSVVSATATQLVGGSGSTPLSTSEFSNAVPAFPPPSPTPSPTPTATPPLPKLANISTRSFVQTGDNVLFGGFIATGTGPVKVLIVAIGPSLGLPGQLADPALELHDSNGVLVDSNDNWVDSSNKQEIMDSGVAPSNALESAIVRTVNAPESYTVIVRGVGDTSGIAVVQVYALQ